MTATRRTIARPVTLEGVGLHLGVACRLTFRPAPAGQGITFVRTDRPGTPTIPAVVEHAVLTEPALPGQRGDALGVVVQGQLRLPQRLAI